MNPKIKFIETIIFNSSPDISKEYIHYEHLFQVGHQIIVLNDDPNINERYLIDMDNFKIDDKKLLKILTNYIDGSNNHVES